MKAEIYADVVFAVNFLMDFFILYAAGKLGGKGIKLRRIGFAAALAAAIYCLVLFNVVLFQFYNFFSGIVIITVAVYIAYIPKKIKELIQLTCYAHIWAFVAGGVGMALFYFTDAGAIFSTGVAITRHFSSKILISSVCLSYAGLKLVQNRLNKSKIQRQCFCTVKVFFQNSNIELRALIDTGNSLTDPITKTPVVIAEFNSIKDCLPTYLSQLFYENKQDDLEAVLSCAENTSFAGRIRFIPFRSVGKKNGMLLGFRPDKIEILTDDTKSVFEKNTIIGIYNAGLSADNEYNALMNPALIEG